MADEKSFNLIEKNGKINISKLQDALLNSPNYLNVIRMLMNNGADPKFLLHFSVKHLLMFDPYNSEKLIKVVNVLLDEYNIDINSTDKNGNTILMNVLKNSEDIMNVHKISEDKEFLLEFLLDRGADPDLQNKDGMTPLSMAVFYGSDNVEIVKLLLERGADPNLSDKD